jgi:hypothetical protein
MRERAMVASLVLVAGCAQVAAAQQNGATEPGMRLSDLSPGARIDAARAQLRDESLSGEERLRALRDLMGALDARLGMSDIPGETRARDAVELAESALTASAWEGVQTTASVGILTPGMRREAERAARRAIDAIDVFRGMGAGAQDETLRVRATLADARAGMLLRASSLSAEVRREALERARTIRDAPTLLRAREGAIEGDAAVENSEAEAQRLTLLGLVALEDGRPAEATERFRGASALALSARTKAEATLGAALATRAIEGPRVAYDRLASLEVDAEFVSIEASDPLVRILRADAMRRVAIAGAEFATGEDLARSVRDASAPYFALAERGVPGIEPIALRALLWDKAGATAGPLLTRVGAGERRAAFERAATSDADGLRAIVSSDEALAAMGPFAPDALWRAAGALRARENDPGAQREASIMLLRLAQGWKDDPRVGAALGGAASSAQRASALTNESGESLDLYERALRAAIAHVERTDDPALREDSLRFELGRVFALRERDDEASAELARVPAQGELGLRAAELLLSLAQRAGDDERVARAAGVVTERAEGLLAQGENELARRAIERAGAVGQNAELRAAIERGDAGAAASASGALANSGAPNVDRALRAEAIGVVEGLAMIERERGDLNAQQRTSARVGVAIASALVELSERERSSALEGDRVLLARAQRMTGDAALAREAAGAIERAMTRAGRAPELLAELGESLHAAGEDERAFPVYRELSNATRPDDARTRSLHWLAWGRMLQILAKNNADGSRSATIRAQAERLRLVDPELGGSPHRERIKGAVKSAE